MPSLSNPRHERFAQELAKGKSAAQAYVDAGYEADGHSAEVNASRLLRKAEVSRRVAELQERGAMRTEITIEKLTEMLLEDREAARAAGQFGPAISALEKIAKLHGLFNERRQNREPRAIVLPTALTTEEWIREVGGEVIRVEQ